MESPNLIKHDNLDSPRKPYLSFIFAALVMTFCATCSLALSGRLNGNTYRSELGPEMNVSNFLKFNFSYIYFLSF